MAENVSVSTDMRGRMESAKKKSTSALRAHIIVTNTPRAPIHSGDSHASVTTDIRYYFFPKLMKLTNLFIGYIGW